MGLRDLDLVGLLEPILLTEILGLVGLDATFGVSVLDASSQGRRRRPAALPSLDVDLIDVIGLFLALGFLRGKRESAQASC